jgi:hypothetical protein
MKMLFSQDLCPIFSLCFIFDNVGLRTRLFVGKKGNIFAKQLTFEGRFAKINMYVILLSILKGQKL